MADFGASVRSKYDFHRTQVWSLHRQSWFGDMNDVTGVAESDANSLMVSSYGGNI